jgi:rubrerythrin
MSKLKGSKTETSLKDAFAGESQANRRYLYFAAKADVEGFNDVSAVFRSTAEGETGHAHGHLEYLEQCGDPATGLPIGATSDNLKAAIAGETHEYTDMYPGMAKTRRRLCRNRRLVRDAGQGRAFPRQPVSEGPRHPGQVSKSELWL